MKIASKTSLISFSQGKLKKILIFETIFSGHLKSCCCAFKKYTGENSAVRNVLSKQKRGYGCILGDLSTVLHYL